jgi:hypothetical protein
LWQFIDFGTTENVPKAGHPRVALWTDTGPRQGSLEHGAKLVHLKGLAIFADAITAIQDWSPRIELDQQTDKGEEREHEH